MLFNHKIQEIETSIATLQRQLHAVQTIEGDFSSLLTELERLIPLIHETGGSDALNESKALLDALFEKSPLEPPHFIPSFELDSDSTSQELLPSEENKNTLESVNAIAITETQHLIFSLQCHNASCFVEYQENALADHHYFRFTSTSENELLPFYPSQQRMHYAEKDVFEAIGNSPFLYAQAYAEALSIKKEEPSPTTLQEIATYLAAQSTELPTEEKQNNAPEELLISVSSSVTYSVDNIQNIQNVYIGGKNKERLYRWQQHFAAKNIISGYGIGHVKPAQHVQGFKHELILPALSLQTIKELADLDFSTNPPPSQVGQERRTNLVEILRKPASEDELSVGDLVMSFKDPKKTLHIQHFSSGYFICLPTEGTPQEKSNPCFFKPEELNLIKKGIPVLDTAEELTSEVA